MTWVTRQTVYNWRKEGCPVFISSQKTMRYDLDAVMRWLRKRKDKTFKEMNNIMKFDEGNQIFLKLIKKLNV